MVAIDSNNVVICAISHRSGLPFTKCQHNFLCWSMRYKQLRANLLVLRRSQSVGLRPFGLKSAPLIARNRRAFVPGVLFIYLPLRVSGYAPLGVSDNPRTLWYNSSDICRVCVRSHFTSVRARVREPYVLAIASLFFFLIFAPVL